MKLKQTILTLALALAAGTSPAQSIWDAAHLADVKQSLDQPYYAAAYRSLLRQADRLLDAEPLSVMMKDKTPASGDKHDYLSQARYYWPDPTKPDGLPYVNRDGQSNSELNSLDRNRLGDTASRVTTLALAWYFSGNEAYAEKATELIRVWFFDKKTRMNPHLEYAQMIPGLNNGKGRCYGVLDGYSFVEMLDAVQLLEQSEAFTARDAKQLKAWFGKLLDWILTSPQGREESAQKNNHATAYDAQVIAFALYTGRHDVAREFIEAVPAKRLFTQIEPDGSQPQELRRTLGFGYSQYNLTHFIDIFRMAQKTNAQMMAIRIPVFSGIVLALPVRMVEMMYRMTKMISGNNPTKLPFLFPIINSLLILDPPDRSAGRPLCHVCGLLLHQNLTKYYHKSKQISTLY